MTAAIKKQFISELNPLLAEAADAIVARNGAESDRLSLEVLQLIARYERKLSRGALRDALNNPMATAIAKRLGVHPR
jgi:hypothetical protein